MMQRIRGNVAKANVTGRLVSADQRSALVVAELLDTDPQTGKPLDYVKVGDALEKIRHKYETPGVRSEEHTSELQSLMRISYAVFCLTKKKRHTHVLNDDEQTVKHSQQTDTDNQED